MNKNKVNNIDNGIVDYKFFCFNGTPFCVQVDSSRYIGHRQNFFDMEWQQLKVHCSYPEGEGVEMPPHFQQMKKWLRNCHQTSLLSVLTYMMSGVRFTLANSPSIHQVAMALFIQTALIMN